MRQRVIEVLVCALLVSILCFCLGFVAPVQFLVMMIAGWGMFLYRVVPQVELDIGAVILSSGALLFFGLGLHALLRWLSSAVAPKLGPWRPRWTVSIVVLTVLMFVAGIAFVGITHQVVWLATSQDPLMTTSGNYAYRVRSMSKVRNIGIGTFGYVTSKQGELPPGASVDREGRLLHSWMTMLLPYCEHQALFDSIDSSRPWDDPAQGDAFQRQVQVFESGYPQLRGTKDPRGRALTHYSANVHVMGGTGKRTRQSIADADGITNTLLLGEAAGDFKAWGQPGNWRDPALGINQTTSGFGSPSEAGAIFAFADGSTRFMSSAVSPEVLRALATPDGGERLNANDY